MITNYETTNVLNAQIMGLSTDTKPTTGVQPNSLFWELDTNGMYFFDGTQWQPIGGSGGGGGESDFSTAQVTFVNATTEVTNIPFIVNDPEENLLGMMGIAFREYLPNLTVVLYKGHCYITGNSNWEISGNITYDSDADLYDITGDCTITMPPSD